MAAEAAECAFYDLKVMNNNKKMKNLRKSESYSKMKMGNVVECKLPNVLRDSMCTLVCDF